MSGRCVGAALVSHGAGGSERGYRYLAEALRADGWLAVVVGHAESGLGVARRHVAGQGGRNTGLLALVTDPAAHRARAMDVEAAIRWARGHCDAPRTVLLGHSMGAVTVMLEAGAKSRIGVGGHDAFDAYVALSPQGVGSLFDADAWSGIGKPVLIVTGTRDGALEGDWTTRTAPFDAMPAGCKWLAVIDGANHLDFAGIGASAATERLTIHALRDFLDRAARGDCNSAPPAAAGLTLKTR